MKFCHKVCACTLGSAYNEFGCNEHPTTTRIFLCIKIIDCNVKKFSYNENPLIRSSYFCVFLLIVSGTQCTFVSLKFLSNCFEWINEPILWHKISSPKKPQTKFGLSIHLLFFCVFQIAVPLLPQSPLQFWCSREIFFFVVSSEKVDIVFGFITVKL